VSCLPGHFQIELVRCFCSYTTQYARLGGKREWDLRQVIDLHLRCDNYCGNLGADAVLAKLPGFPVLRLLWVPPIRVMPYCFPFEQSNSNNLN